MDVVAAQRGEETLPRRDQARKRRRWLTNRANLPHRLAVNQFFTDLAGHARIHPGTGLERRWPSSRCQQQGAFAYLDGGLDVSAWRATIAADGHGVWTDTTPVTGPVRVPFFVEVDPHFARNTGTGEPVATATRLARATIEVLHLDDHPTLLDLPTLG